MTNKILAIIRLLRVKQYYKNLILFIGVFFGGKLFDFSVYPQLFLAYILMCLISSLNYIQNDVKDIEKDKLHPEKMKQRPLASGDLSKTTAWFLFTIIVIIELYYIIFNWSSMFALLLIAIYLNGLAYNYVLKNYAFADLVGLSMIYIWRALAGCIIINIHVSPWLIITFFLLAMFLAICKRIADFTLLGEAIAIKHKPIYQQYSSELLRMTLIMVATSLFIIYTLYCVLGINESNSNIPEQNRGYFVYSVPIAFYLIGRYLYLLQKKPEIARNTEKALKDPGLFIGGVILMIVIVFIIYMINPLFFLTNI